MIFWGVPMLYKGRGGDSLSQYTQSFVFRSSRGGVMEYLMQAIIHYGNLTQVRIKDIFITLRVVCFYTFSSVTSSSLNAILILQRRLFFRLDGQARKSKWHFIGNEKSLVNYKHNIRFTSILFSLVQFENILERHIHNYI
jgi:hypothetical protein